MRTVEFAAAVVAALSLTAGGMASAAMLIPKPAPQAPQQPEAQSPPQSQQKPAPQSQQKPAPQSPQRAAPESRSQGRHYGNRSYDHRPHIHRHFIAPAPIFVPPPVYYSPAPYYAPPPVYYAPLPYADPPPVYVERTNDYWYYCAELAAYYPDVTQCPGPWQPVPAR